MISAGGLVFREAAGRIETLLCARNRPGFLGADAPLSWRLPKGTPETGESVEQTARREVQEETGLQVTVLAPITSIRYYFVGHNDGVRYDKTVYFYLMEPSGGSTSTTIPSLMWLSGVSITRRWNAGVRQRTQRAGRGSVTHRNLSTERAAMTNSLVLRGVRVLLRGKRMRMPSWITSGAVIPKSRAWTPPIPSP